MAEGQLRLPPQDASSLGLAPTLRTLVQGYPGVGKSTTCVESLTRAFGFGYAINCGTATSLQPALRATGPGKWQFNNIDYEGYYEDQFEAFIANAREGVSAKKFKWIFVDDYNVYVDQLVGAYINDDTQKDFNRWTTFCRRVTNAVHRLFVCDAHVVFTCHVTDWKSTQLPGQNKKEGSGFVAAFPGALRVQVPMLFAEKVVLRFDDDNPGRRVLSCNERGVYGVACRTLGQEVEIIDADLGLLQKEVEKWGKGPATSKAGPKPPVQKSAAPGRPAPATPKPSPNPKGNVNHAPR
jgi:hypothetical protein